VSHHPVMLQRSALTAVRDPKGRMLITHTCSACLVCHGRVIDTAVGYAVLIACGDLSPVSIQMQSLALRLNGNRTLSRPSHTEREA